MKKILALLALLTLAGCNSVTNSIPNPFSSAPTWTVLSGLPTNGFFGHGVFVTGGTATFTVNSFTP